MKVLEGSPKHTVSRYVEWLIPIVVLVNCSAVILDSIPEVQAEHKDFSHKLEFWNLMFFTLDLRLLRLLRLLRILKLSKYNTALQDLFQAVYAKRRAFGSAAFLLLISSVVSASLMHFAEGHEQPEAFGSIPHAIYWAIVTITAGYGNVEPVTKAGEMIALLTGFLGVCMAAILTGVVATAYTAQVQRRESIYEMEVREVLADGVVTEEEKSKG